MVATFFSWDNDEPKDGQNCAVKYPDNKKWKTNYCKFLHSFMCYNEPLVLVKEKKTWEEALKHCRSLEPVDPSQPATAYQNYRYDLVTLLTQEDHDIARKKAQRATTAEVWTGLHYLAGHWVWVGGGGDVQYTNTEGCPTQRFCGVLLKTGSTLFDTRDCGESKNFLCYRKP
ncbi:FRAS1-related extracellular matrix protein 1-like [Micropterus dolomieu]|uniref:FRAS1-related extracellular matrix protein 1-like n=1 Tax=Micropterus dolomieu TaxID=147949 RepID=UPI001E8D7033|nr:FRAS1-related extracellular matrix protein 1-like [Micropterus dolomieu]